MKNDEFYSQKAGRIVIPDEVYAVEVFNYKVRRLSCPTTKYIYGVLQHEIGPIAFNPLTPELNPSAQRSLTRFFNGDFASWTVHFVNICVTNQQM
jgi:hypothetical protein